MTAAGRLASVALENKEKTDLPASPIIAVIDDDESVRSSTGGLLRSCGYRVRMFASAEEFLNASDAGDCVCVVSDVHMPGKSGFDLLKELAKRETPKPVVLITAYYNEAAVAKAKSAGAVCILPKPFGADDLIACINNAIGA